MDYIKEWLKTILYMNVLLLICSGLIQKTKYESYFRFFSGFLLLLCLVKPLIDIAGADRYMDASFLQNQLKNQWKIIEQSQDLRKMEKEVQEEYEQASQKQIKELATSCNLVMKDVEVKWKNNTNTIQSIEIEVKESEEEGKTPRIHKFREALEAVYALEEQNIEIVVED